MANNQYVNKVVYNDSTLIDLTEDTVTPEALIEGYTAHNRSGAPIVGSAVIPYTNPLVVSIPSGQWSGSGSDYYITVTASNVTVDSILVPSYDNTSEAYLKGSIWCVPASGSFTIHTSAIPTGTVNILIQFPGLMGEANYQVLADVYSKSQAVAKVDIVNDLTNSATDKPAAQKEAYDLNNMFKTSSYTAWSATGQTSGDIYLARYGKVRLLSFSDVAIPSGATFSITELPVGDRPGFLTVGSLSADETSCVSIWVRTVGSFGYTAAILGHTINGQIVWIAV